MIPSVEGTEDEGTQRNETESLGPEGEQKVVSRPPGDLGLLIVDFLNKKERELENLDGSLTPFFSKHQTGEPPSFLHVIFTSLIQR